MTHPSPHNKPHKPLGPLHAELLWFSRLRWIAGAAIALFGCADLRWLGWYDRSRDVILIGLVVLVYNAAIALALRWRLPDRRDARRKFLRLLAWTQIVLDVACLSLLTTWTGGVYSPIRGFFVFHMIFAALLLPRAFAYATACLALAMLTGSLWVYEKLPQTRDARLVFAGTAVMFAAVVYLASRAARALRSQRHRVVLRNRRIHRMSRQLRRHQKAMVQQEKMFALGQMAAGVTHEIANPLAAIDSVLQLLQRKPDRFTPETVTTLREQVQRVFQIIQQMKNFAHPAAEADRESLPVNEVVQQALDLLRFDPRRKRVAVETVFDGTLSSADQISASIQQVLVNLIVNALDAVQQTPEPHITLRTVGRETHYLVEVADNGHGIRPEHVSRLFEPFFTTKPVGTGTGLGLSISYKLVDRQGGRITVRSDVGKGTTFTIRLPRSNPPSRKRETPAANVLASEKTSA